MISWDMKNMAVNEIYYSANHSLCMIRQNNILPNRTYVPTLQVKGDDKFEKSSKKWLAALLIGLTAAAVALILAKRGKGPDVSPFRYNRGDFGGGDPPDVTSIRLNSGGGKGNPPDTTPVRLMRGSGGGNPPDNNQGANILINHNSTGHVTHEQKIQNMSEPKSHKVTFFGRLKIMFENWLNKRKYSGSN